MLRRGKEDLPGPGFAELLEGQRLLALLGPVAFGEDDGKGDAVFLKEGRVVLHDPVDAIRERAESAALLEKRPTVQL